MQPQDQQQLVALAELANCNPFSPARFQLEKTILGKKFVAEDALSWNRRHDQQPGDRANVIALTQRAIDLVTHIQNDMRERQTKLDPELNQSYWDVVAYVLLYRHVTSVSPLIFLGTDSSSQTKTQQTWHAFRDDYQTLMDVDGQYSLKPTAAAHLFACLVQVHRTFFQVFDHILGDSTPVARMREKVWESVFSYDLGRYHDGLYDQMRDLATLITGPSGTGKELVARAIGMSQYVPFDLESESFKMDAKAHFLPLNLSALSSTLIESELFGHHRGAFTGAVADRAGWLESCSPYGAVFLDEIGELDATLQVKLLRVLQQRNYCRLGETKQRKFRGKIISATNRNLDEEIRSRRFREDFYFRLCSDRIETPSLRDQLDDRPEDLYQLALWIARKLTGNRNDALTTRRSNQLAAEATDWIDQNLGDRYPWAGNIRELEQCISSIMLRSEYVPLRFENHESPAAPTWSRPILDGTATADDVLRLYCTSVYARNRSYEQTGTILGMDRRTVKAKVNPVLLRQLLSEPPNDHQ